MSAQAMIDIEDVRAELRIEDVAERYDLCKYSGKPTARLSRCPRCGATSSSSAIVINFRKQRWGHYGCGKLEAGRCYGDALDLLAACENLDRQRDFLEVIAVAAQIANVPARELSDDERAARRIDRERRQQERDRHAAEADERRHHAAKWLAAGDWHRMLRGRPNAAGMSYLRARGLDARRLVDDDHIRFDRIGNVCVPLSGFDGELVNVVRRRIHGGEPKVLGLEGCPTDGSLCGRLQQITSASTIITEGVTDTLTAIQRWPGRLVIGAHGAGRLLELVTAAAPRVLAANGKIVLVPDGDDIGKRQAIRAGIAALRAGLVMDKTLLVVDVAPYHDLNEAHCKGWTP